MATLEKEKAAITREKERVEFAVPQPLTAVPPLKWISGKIHQILLQDKEQYYVFVLVDGQITYQARFGDPYTGKSFQLTADNPMYAMLQEAYFYDQKVQLGVRSFGNDPQSGTEKIVIDRVSLYR